ncbi:MAG: hypothetical protein AAGK14_03965 [Verrucomicrobiota bacterium]
MTANPQVESASPAKAYPKWAYGLVFALAFGLAIAFAAYTDSAWEDWYITFRASQNLAEGNGLVFTEGQRVHTFTSPLGVLIPAGLSYLVGSEAERLTLWLYRIINALVLGATAVLLMRMSARLALGYWPMVLLVGLFLLDSKTLAFSINGMETAYLVFFGAMSLYCLYGQMQRRFLWLGLAWAGLMWTRPDGCIYVAAVGVGWLLFAPVLSDVRSRAGYLLLFLKAGLVTTALYLPWLLWAWSYYGTPVPNTVVAKGISFAEGGSEELSRLPRILYNAAIFPYIAAFKGYAYDTIFVEPQFPTFYKGEFYWKEIVSRLIVLWATFGWVVPWVFSRAARAASFAALLGMMYFALIMPIIYPWYIPGVMMLIIWAAAVLLHEALVFARERLSPTRFRLCANGGAVAVVVLLLFSLSVLVNTTRMMEVQQRVIERGLREPMALWLKENSQTPQDTVFIECLGYSGFYSGLKFYDFPGLSSPEMIAARKKLGTDNWARLIAYLKPDWVVLRDTEVEKVNGDDPALLSARYQEVKRFDRSEEIASIEWLPIRKSHQYDDVFIVFARQDGPGSGAGAPTPARPGGSTLAD